MSRIYNQVCEDPNFHYNHGWKDADSYAAWQRKQQEELWAWWEQERDLLNQELREESQSVSVVIYEDGYRVHHKIRRD